jgi:hypothetical protein
MMRDSSRRCAIARIPWPVPAASTLCLIALALTGVALSACGMIREPARERVESAPAASRVLYIVRRGWHVDIGFRVAEIGPRLGPFAEGFPGASYLLFGFGDRHYLLARKRGVRETLGALWPGDGLVLLTALKSAPGDAFPAGKVIALRVTPAQERDAERFVRRSIVADETEPRAYAPGPYDGSLFFLATKRYSALYTCNTWVADALAAAGLPVHGPRVLLAGELWAQVRRLQDGSRLK